MIAHIEIPIIGKKAKYSLLWLIAVGVLILATTMTLKVVNRKTSKQDIAQLTIPVTERSVIVHITASGKVQPLQSVNISPKNPGILAKLDVEQGETLQQWQIIAQMDNSEIKTQILQYQAKLTQAKAQLAESQAGSRSEDIGEAKAHLAEAEAHLSVLREGNRLQEIEQAPDSLIEETLNFLLSAQASYAKSESNVGEAILAGVYPNIVGILLGFHKSGVVLVSNTRTSLLTGATETKSTLCISSNSYPF